MTSTMNRRALAVAISAIGGGPGRPALAQAGYPNRPISMVIPFAAGGPTDTVGRLIAQAMGAELGQTVVVENAGGAGGTIGAQRVAHARPDGYTILLHHIGMATIPTPVSPPRLRSGERLRAARPGHRGADDADRRRNIEATNLAELRRADPPRAART